MATHTECDFKENEELYLRFFFPPAGAAFFSADAFFSAAALASSCMNAVMIRSLTTGAVRTPP
jgi:hypothetical protein